MTRRKLIKWGAGSTLAVGLGRALGAQAAVRPDLFAGKNPRPARACILLYMARGPSHIDTFDPKPGRKAGGPGGEPGFLPATYPPFPVNNPLKPVRYLGRAKGIDSERFEERLALWRKLEDRYGAGRGGDFARSHRAVGEQAAELMKSKGVAAFRLDDQPEGVREAYGKTEFGAGCLMARRLVEAGVPFVEVTLGGWDTHEANFDRVGKLSPILDQGMAALLEDLHGRG